MMFKKKKKLIYRDLDEYIRFSSHGLGASITSARLGSIIKLAFSPMILLSISIITPPWG